MILYVTYPDAPFDRAIRHRRKITCVHRWSLSTRDERIPRSKNRKARALIVLRPCLEEIEEFHQIFRIAAHMNIDEFKSHARSCQSTQIFRLVVLLVPFFMVLAVCKLAVVKSDDIWTKFIPAIVLVLFVPGLVCGAKWVENACRSIAGMLCPNCSKPLTQSKSIVIATGNCPNCGRRVLNDNRIGT